MLKKIKIIIAVVILSFITFILTEEVFAKNKSKNKKRSDYRSHRTIFFDLKNERGSKNSVRKINRAIAKALKRIKTLSLVPDSELIDENNKKTECFEEKLAFEYGDLLTADKVIIGSIKRTSEKYNEALGSSGGNKYIMQTKYNYSFEIKINILSVLKKKSIIVIKETFEESDTAVAMRRIRAKLRPYFRQIDLEKEKEEIKKAEEIYVKSDNYYFLVGYSFLLPMGSFNNTIGFGHGAAWHGGVRHLLFKNSSFGVMGSYHYAVAEKDYIRSYSLLTLGGTAGYSFNLSENFRITPFLKIGYLIHLIVHDETYIVVGYEDREGAIPFFDPFAAFQIEFAYNFYHDFHFFLSAEYTSYLEMSGAGMFSSFNAGLKIHF